MGAADDERDDEIDGGLDDGADDSVRERVAALLAAAGLDPPAAEVDRLAGLYPALRRSLDRFHRVDTGDEVTAAVFRAGDGP